MNNPAKKGPWRASRLSISAFAALFLLAGGGCGNGSAEVPSDAVARAALEGALKTWRDGGKPGTLTGMDPAVQVTDTPWSRGDRLGSYEIIKEEASGAEKRFTVKLTLTKPERVEEVQYHVLGQGPVLIFREEDYQLNINMVDDPTAKSGKQKLLKKK